MSEMTEQDRRIVLALAKGTEALRLAEQVKSADAAYLERKKTLDTRYASDMQNAMQAYCDSVTAAVQAYDRRIETLDYDDNNNDDNDDD